MSRAHVVLCGSKGGFQLERDGEYVEVAIGDRVVFRRGLEHLPKAWIVLSSFDASSHPPMAAPKEPVEFENGRQMRATARRELGERPSLAITDYTTSGETDRGI